MNFPQFWARGNSGDFSAWRWSFQSLAEAQVLADAAARQVAERFRAGQRLPKYGGYYPDRPCREQVIREIANASGEWAAVISRNSYGCLVLNTARAMFVDIDLPEPKKGGIFKRLFGKPEPSENNASDDAIARVESWTRVNPDWGWRVYRTRAGLRLLATQGLVEPAAAVSNDVLAALGADPLYQKLCNTQKCFRARLTPKPWRCGVREKPERWPWIDQKHEQRCQRWDEQYQRAAQDFATCEFVRQVGNRSVHAELEPIVSLHDGLTRSDSKLALA